jgi:hypothetical protein
MFDFLFTSDKELRYYERSIWLTDKIEQLTVSSGVRSAIRTVSFAVPLDSSRSRRR